MNKNEKIEKMLQYAISNIGKPYKWGGNGRDNFDCSGFALSCLKVSSFFPADVDTTAQDIYFYLANQGWKEEKRRGAICFFGKRKDRITHVGIVIEGNNFIGANGGDSSTINEEIAKKQNAKVDIRVIRKDLITCLYPA